MSKTTETNKVSLCSLMAKLDDNDYAKIQDGKFFETEYAGREFSDDTYGSYVASKAACPLAVLGVKLGFVINERENVNTACNRLENFYSDLGITVRQYEKFYNVFDETVSKLNEGERETTEEITNAQINKKAIEKACEVADKTLEVK